jgi:hypothetical protein
MNKMNKTNKTWENFYSQHPGWTKFDDMYLNHIININEMIQNISSEFLYPIYQYGNSGKLVDFIVKCHPKLINKLMKEGEKEFSQMPGNADTTTDENYNEKLLEMEELDEISSDDEY